MDSIVAGGIGIIIMVVVLLMGMPVAFSVSVVGFAGFAYLVSVKGALAMLSDVVWMNFGSYTLTVIPMFVFAGEICFRTGISEKLYNAAYKWAGQFSGGLAMTTILACAGFAAISGSSSATAATIGAVALPEMKKYKYDMALATGSVASGGALGVLIPPSVLFILYGILTQQSIGELFFAGVIPGLILTGLMVVTITILSMRNPLLGPKGPRTTWREKIAAIPGIGEVAALFVLVMGGLYAGFFTPTEAGAAAAFGSLVITGSRGLLSWEKLRTAAWSALKVSCMVILLITGAGIFGRFLAISRIPAELSLWLTGLPVPDIVILLGIMLIYILAGCIMDSLSFLMLSIPIFYPAVQALGYDAVWFGVLIILLCEIGAITPPYGINVYIVAGLVPDVPLTVIFKGALFFLVALLLTIVIVVLFPQTALFLPGLMH